MSLYFETSRSANSKCPEMSITWFHMISQRSYYNQPRNQMSYQWTETAHSVLLQTKEHLQRCSCWWRQGAWWSNSWKHWNKQQQTCHVWLDLDCCLNKEDKRIVILMWRLSWLLHLICCWTKRTVLAVIFLFVPFVLLGYMRMLGGNVCVVVPSNVYMMSDECNAFLVLCDVSYF